MSSVSIKKMTDILVIDGQLNEYWMEQIKITFLNEFGIPLTISGGMSDTWFKVEYREERASANISNFYYFLRGMLNGIKNAR